MGRTAGPYAYGPPPEALVVDAPSITGFGLAELRRMVVIYVVLIGQVGLALARWLPRRRSRTWQTAASEGAVRAFEILGPTFVKLGQLMASSPGLFPAPLADACLRCLDEVPPFPTKQVRKIVRTDLGRPVEKIFAGFEDVPLSAASIAQVHACVLPDGRRAVVKVQRPNIRRRMTVDLRIMYRIARLLERYVSVFKMANATAIVADLHGVTFAELNSALEAHRQDRFRAAIGTFGDNKWVTAPEVYWDRCGPHVICMERMFGTPIDEFDTVAASGVDPELMVRRGVKAWLEALAVHGPFHGDVHAGNLWLLDDGRLALLDFGIMGELPEQWRGFLRDLFYTAMIDGDFTRIARSIKKLGVVDDSTGTDKEIGQRLGLVFGPLLDANLSKISLGQLLKTFVHMGRQYGGTNPKELVLVSKQLAYFERYAKEFAPEWVLAKDLFLFRNIFPDEVARKAAELGVILPAD